MAAVEDGVAQAKARAVEKQVTEIAAAKKIAEVEVENVKKAAEAAHVNYRW